LKYRIDSTISWISQLFLGFHYKFFRSYPSFQSHILVFKPGPFKFGELSRSHTMIATAAAARTQPAWTGRARQPAVPQQRCVSGGREPLAAVPSESMSGGPPVLRAEPGITGGAEPLYPGLSSHG
jgi:hypothetical protein